MSFPEKRIYELDENPAGTLPVGTGHIMNIDQMSEKGYDFLLGGAAFTANLEGSVAGNNWTVITALGASSQGAIPSQYNRVRVVCSAGGAVGTSSLFISGKVL